VWRFLLTTPSFIYPFNSRLRFLYPSPSYQPCGLRLCNQFLLCRPFVQLYRPCFANIFLVRGNLSANQNYYLNYISTLELENAGFSFGIWFMVCICFFLWIILSFNVLLVYFSVHNLSCGPGTLQKSFINTDISFQDSPIRNKYSTKRMYSNMEQSILWIMRFRSTWQKVPTTMEISENNYSLQFKFSNFLRKFQTKCSLLILRSMMTPNSFAMKSSLKS
jgi:hypothetical protein